MLNHAPRTPLLALLCLALIGCCCTPAPKAGPVLTGHPGERCEEPQVFIDLMTVRIPEQRVERVLGTRRPSSANEPISLSKIQAEEVRAAWRADKDVQVISEPKLLALAGQEATVRVGQTLVFAKTEANQDGGLHFEITGDPSGPVFLGWKMRLVATPSQGGERIALDLHARWTEEMHRLEEEPAVAMDGTEFRRSGMVLLSLDSSFEMKNGGHVLLGDPEVVEDRAGRHVRLTLLHARLLAAEGAEAMAVGAGQPPAPPPAPGND